MNNYTPPVSSFTVGPWHVEPTNSARLSNVVVSDVQGSNGSTVVIGQCAGPDKDANAALIAMAPQLYAFVAAAARRDPVFAKGSDKQLIADARDLIQKAGGGQPTGEKENVR